MVTTLVAIVGVTEILQFFGVLVVAVGMVLVLVVGMMVDMVVGVLVVVVVVVGVYVVVGSLVVCQHL